MIESFLREREVTLTLCGAGSRAILALVMIPNWPRPPRTAWKSSGFCFCEHVKISPLPVTQNNELISQQNCQQVNKTKK